MFVPLHDNTPLRVIRFQFVTGLLFAINVAVFLYSHIYLDNQAESAFATSLGAIPALLTDHAVLAPNLELIPEPATLISYMFIHAGWMHLISNMLFLWVFADNVEDAFGHFGFLIFYLVCGIAAALAHSFVVPASEAPLIGASGAVSGVLAAYLLLFPKARIWVLLFMKLPIPIPAMWALAGWFGFQVLSVISTDASQVTVAWWAHIGGFVAGFIITLPLRGYLRSALLRRYE